MHLREEIDSSLSGPCCSATANAHTPLFAISKEEANYVNCHSGLPSISEGNSFLNDDEGDASRPSTYGEITMLGARQLFYHLGLTSHPHTSSNNKPNFQFFDLGSGGGRLVIQSHLELPSLSKSVGIELSPSRHAIAVRTWKELVSNGDAERIRRLAERSWGIVNEDHVLSTVELLEGDLFELDISQATHIYVSSLCFSEDMLERLVEKIETEGKSLQYLASLRLLPLTNYSNLHDGNNNVDGNVGKNKDIKRIVELGRNPWMNFVEMSWTKARGDGCPVYFYSTKKLAESS